MKKNFDIIIVGASMVGMSLAKALGDINLQIAIIEAKNINYIDDLKDNDGRAIAIAAGSKKFLNDINIWPFLVNNTEEMRYIKIIDHKSPIELNYDSSLVSNEPMGYMIESHDLIKGLYKSIKDHDNITIIDGQKVKSYQSDAYRTSVILDNDNEISAQLLIAADGKNSFIRKLAKIAIRTWEYKQQAIILSIKHSNHHNNVAYEKFRPSGPFAILPLKGGHKSGVVWTEKANLVPTFMAMDDDEFYEHLMERIGNSYQDVEIVSNKICYPLSATHAKKYFKDRMVLVGDSAHSMHPIAGQGFNVGLRDVKELYQIIQTSQALGLDIGFENNLEKYYKNRKNDNSKMIMATDQINHLFCSDFKTVKLARNIGLSIVENIPPLKKIFMKYAMFGK